MLDIKFIRENKELIKEAARKKRIEFDIDKLVEIDDKRKTLLARVEEKRAEQNGASKEIVKAIGLEKTNFLAKMKFLKDELQRDEEELANVMREWQILMLHVPNIPDVSVPEGESEADNKEIRRWGDLPKFDFAPRDHIAVMEDLGMLDLERGTKVSGFRGYVLKGGAVRLNMAIWQYALDFFSEKGLDPHLVPSLVRREILLGTGYLPQGEDDLYKNQDGGYFAGTSEVATMGLYRDEEFSKSSLPKKFLSFSTCFRREAGSHSKDVKGLIRVHEFFKWEQVILCEASHEESTKWHEWLHRNIEEFIESLGISYRTVINSSGDLGLGQVKKYDIELWVPLENTYREIGSTSYFHDFQTRRLNIRYRDEEGKFKYAHSLNATAIATPRILVSLIENFQQEDGSVKIPDVLSSYLGGLLVIGK
jgi:seryl-tRNA synthetase